MLATLHAFVIDVVLFIAVSIAAGSFIISSGKLHSIKIHGMFLKLLSGVLMLVAVFMGLKQGYAMITAKPEMLHMFGKWNFTKTGLLVNGLITAISALLILHPKTFLLGNFLMAAGILLIICFHLQDKDLKGVLIELPFLLINLILLYSDHPFKR